MLIVLLGAGNGLIHAFESSASEMAMNSIKIYPGLTTKPYEGMKQGRQIQLDNADVSLTEDKFPENVISVGASLRKSEVFISYGKEYVNCSLNGVYPNYTEVERVKLIVGRFVNDIDIRERRKVIILHQKTAEVLCKKSEDAIGKFFNASGVAYQVVGLYTDRGDRDSREAYIPFSTLQIIYSKGDKLDNIAFTIR
ncbi:hypothetical protein EZS27_028112, partial [termite gut metagenome]